MFTFITPVAYASTYYRFKYFISFLKKRQPQIVADVPHRVNKTKPLPILIIVRNADVYPLKISELAISVDDAIVKTVKLEIGINTDYREYIQDINISDFDEGWHRINIRISYILRSQKYICFNDNYRGTSHQPFPCYFSSDDLPKLDGFVHAEMHSHSNYTNDQIEFGASLNASAVMAQAIGLNCIAVTDHSYDLDDLENNFLRNDPDLKKWKKFKAQVAAHNSSNSPVKIIPGEEVSVRNKKNHTVHLLVYNSPEYYPGNGDSGEEWFKFYSSLSIDDVISKIPSDAVAFAAHPTDSIPGSHKILLNRDEWALSDAENENLTGVQVFNGHGKDTIQKSVTFWTSLLLGGHKKFVLAGNDAHGNFGRNRSIHVPFISIAETYTQLFGLWRTDIFLGKKQLNIPNLIDVLQDGNYSVSNGPLIDFSVCDTQNTEHPMGSIVQHAVNGRIRCRSNNEFGKITKCIVYFGELNNSKEEIYYKNSATDNFNPDLNFKITPENGPGYFRAEIRTKGPKGQHFAFSNPIWIQDKI